MTIQNRSVDYSDGETTMKGWMTWDDSVSGKRPAVLVAHAWGGQTDFERAKAVKLAEKGYVGFAIDVYGDGATGDSKEENSALLQPFLEDRVKLQRRMHQALSCVKEQPEVDGDRVAGIGFCFGGLAVLDLARSDGELSGVVSFHGLFGAPGNTDGKTISAKVLCLHGWDDPMAPPEHVTALAQELSKAGADWQLIGYGGTMHAFTNPEAADPDFGTVYSALADQRSWQAMDNFLGEIFA